MATTQLKCNNCGAALGEADIDFRRGTATCPFCGGRTSLPAESSASVPPVGATTPPATATQPGVRRKVPRPDSVAYSETVGGIRLTYRWFTPALFFMLFFCIAWDGFLVFWYSMGIGFQGPNWPFALLFFVFPIAHVAIGVGLTYTVIAGFLNRTQIEMTRDELSVTHVPVPWKGNKRIPAGNVEQLFSSLNVGSKGAQMFAVNALLKDGRKEKLVAMLHEADEARYIERTIEDYFGWDHQPVAGALE